MKRRRKKSKPDGMLFDPMPSDEARDHAARERDPDGPDALQLGGQAGAGHVFTARESALKAPRERWEDK